MIEVDAHYGLKKTMHEVLPRLFAIGHDVQTGVFLFFQHQYRRVALGGLELRPLRLPLRPKFSGFGKPEWLGQAAGDRGFEHGTSGSHHTFRYSRTTLESPQ